MVALSFVLPHRYRFRVAKGYGQCMMVLLRVLCDINFVVEGREHLPKGPCVVLLKHSSPWETIAELVVFPPHAIILKRELMWIPLFGWALASLKSIAINRKAGHSSVSQILEQGKKRIDDGIWVTIFPEGTRVKKGRLGRFGAGGALLAAHAGVPVIPVAHNAADHWPSGELVKTPGTIVLRIGPPIETHDKAPDQINAEAHRWMNQQMDDISELHKQQRVANLTAA